VPAASDGGFTGDEEHEASANTARNPTNHPSHQPRKLLQIMYEVFIESSNLGPVVAYSGHKADGSTVVEPAVHGVTPDSKAPTSGAMPVNPSV
jgi:hypothetical protein